MLYKLFYVLFLHSLRLLTMHNVLIKKIFIEATFLALPK